MYLVMPFNDPCNCDLSDVCQLCVLIIIPLLTFASYVCDDKASYAFKLHAPVTPVERRGAVIIVAGCRRRGRGERGKEGFYIAIASIVCLC